MPRDVCLLHTCIPDHKKNWYKSQQRSLASVLHIPDSPGSPQNKTIPNKQLYKVTSDRGWLKWVGTRPTVIAGPQNPNASKVRVRRLFWALSRFADRLVALLGCIKARWTINRGESVRPIQSKVIEKKARPKRMSRAFVCALIGVLKIGKWACLISETNPSSAVPKYVQGCQKREHIQA